MPRGFFAGSTLVSSKAPISRIPKCGACGLYRQCKSPKMEPTGKGRRKILIIAEAPGKDEDEQGIQLVGKSGKLLMNTLKQFDVDMRMDCTLTNALICRPPGNIITDEKKIGYCRPNLINTIERIKPEVIIPLGGTAVKSLIGAFWKEDVGAIGKWVGWRIPCQRLNAWICPTYHPAYLLRGDDPVVGKYFAHHLQEAVKLEGRPWETVPDYESQVELIYKSRDAAKLIDEFSRRGGVVAFDYETNCLKPDSPEARIISCSVCWRGRRTIAFPWEGDVVHAMKVMLCNSEVKKIASNMKFEDRWTRAKLKVRVRGWLWDTMLAAHLMDNRPDITGLKFQSFVMLGAESYDEHIKPFLKARGNERINEVQEQIELKDLLRYNGLDSLLEYHVAHKQMEMLKYDTRTER